MNRNHLWKLLFILAVLCWSFIEMYPPMSRSLAEVFQHEAVPNRKDAAYQQIIDKLNTLDKEHPTRTFGNLLQAIGTNDITKYFPQYVIDLKSDANPTRAILDRMQRENEGKIHLGLDLQGGTSFLVGMDTSTIDTNNVVARQQALNQAVDVLRRRVDRFGVAEPVIQPVGENRILIQLPGLSEADKESAREQIQKAAFLEFRMVNPDSDSLIKQDIMVPGYVLMTEELTRQNGATTVERLLVAKKAVMTGKYIQSAHVGRDTFGRPTIDFTLDSEGANLFGTITTEHLHERMAIILDGNLISAPTINTEITGGSGEITGSFTDQEAQSLANALQNPLSTPVHVLSESSVDPTLGKDTVKSGIYAAVIGTVLVAGFMAVYYLAAGMVANVALITNIIILLGVMCSYGTTLTLPGIAGIVLTIGMAVDANVLIFERIREESTKGKSLRGALVAGYDRAFGTIFDSHVTTLISSIILIFMGSGPIKGFGVTLTIGVAASLFTALVVTRLIFDFLLAKGILKSLPMLHIIRATKLDFMKLAKPAFALSWTIILVGVAYGGYRLYHGNLFGVDFVGGDNISLAYNEKVDAEKIRTAIRETGIKEPTIQYQSDITGGQPLLRITTPFNMGEEVVKTLQKNFPQAGFTQKAMDKVGPIIGDEIKRTAVVASALSLLGILFYVAVRYEFTFAIGAVVAVIHDILMTIGVYCLTGLLPGGGREFNATMLAAVLTIIGFSINDTIVIFDRIREDLKLGVKGSFAELINQALNQTLSRTIITSGTVFLATMALYLFGGGAINDFAFTFLVGIITGTYSSIYIASALVLWMHHGVRPKSVANTTVVAEGALPSRT